MAFRGGEIARERVYGNFRPEKDNRPKWQQKLARRREKLAEREGNSAEHLALVRKLPCTSCGTRSGVQAHHLRSGPALEHRGVGLKAPDMFAVPLCWICHEALHAKPSPEEPAWFARKGWNVFAYARSLWGNTGNLANMLRVYEAHREDAFRCRLARTKHAPSPAITKGQRALLKRLAVDGPAPEPEIGDHACARALIEKDMAHRTYGLGKRKVIAITEKGLETLAKY